MLHSIPLQLQIFVWAIHEWNDAWLNIQNILKGTLIYKIPLRDHRILQK